MDITDYVLSKTNRIKPEPEVTNNDYQMMNTGGTEVEVAEFLYSLVRLNKPETVVETGTHLGISSLYMALGLEKNGKGTLTTYEVIESLRQQSVALWNDVGVSHRINSRLQPSLSAYESEPIDLLFLDSEPQFRFDEFLHFWPRVTSGGFILIHDLHYTLGKSGLTHDDPVGGPGMKDWPYGPWREKLGVFVQEHDVQILFPPSPRGFTVMQKTRSDFENIKLLRGE